MTLLFINTIVSIAIVKIGYTFNIAISIGLNTICLTVKKIDENESKEQFAVIERNKTLIIEGNRPF